MADDRVDMGWRAIGAFLKKWRQKRRKKKDGIGSAAKEPEMWVENHGAVNKKAWDKLPRFCTGLY